MSNYQEQRKLEKYGTWTSLCLYLAEQRDWWNVAWCGSQYFPANPADFDTWVLTDQQYVQQYADAGLAFPTAAEATHFVVDTSRNGLGPWTPPADHPPGDPQDWCNPDRGLGLRPTSATSSPIIDAYLWVKIPGESDGECTRWAPGGGIDPVREPGPASRPVVPRMAQAGVWRSRHWSSSPCARPRLGVALGRDTPVPQVGGVSHPRRRMDPPSRRPVGA